MSEKLGNDLIEGGVVSADQVRAANENAVLHGGTLAESLFELGFIDDTALAKYVSEKLDVGFVSDDLLGLIDPEMIQIIPEDIAGEHHVMPIEFSNGVLEIAVSDPFDQRISDEIEFFTGFPVKPMVATIRGLARALKSYYGITWNVRPPSLAKAEESVLVNWEQMTEPTAVVKPQPPVAPAPLLEQPAWESPTVRMTPVVAAAPEAVLGDTAPIPAVAPASSPAPAPASATASASAPALSPPRTRPRPRPPADAEIVDEIMGLIHAEEGPQRKPIAARRRRDKERALSVDDALTALAAASSRDDMAELALDALTPQADRVLLATLKGELIVGWAGRGPALSLTKARSFLVPLSLPSVFQQALTTQDVVEDKPGSGPIDLFMTAFLGGTPPARVTAVPVVARGRTVAFIYGDVALASRPSAADAFLRVGAALGAAFDRLLGSAA
ncbi:MAG: hypothetical protein HYY84_04340 [Deltaproteobacteria bacterium]|nr:hypothetical protein [Deltaproteobacteria bacterium]